MRVGIFPKQPRPDAVKRARPAKGGWRVPRRRAERSLQKLPGPALHFRRGPARKRQQQNALRIRAAADKVRDAVGERVGLAGAGAGDDQQRSAVLPLRTRTVLDRESLLSVQGDEEILARVRFRSMDRQDSRRHLDSGNGHGALVERSFDASIAWTGWRSFTLSVETVPLRGELPEKAGRGTEGFPVSGFRFHRGNQDARIGTHPHRSGLTAVETAMRSHEGQSRSLFCFEVHAIAFIALPQLTVGTPSSLR